MYLTLSADWSGGLTDLVCVCFFFIQTKEIMKDAFVTAGEVR